MAPLFHSTTSRATKLLCFFRGHLMPSSASSFRSLFEKLSKHGTPDFNQEVSIRSSSLNNSSWCTLASTKGFHECPIAFFYQIARWRISLRLRGVFQHCHLRGLGPQRVYGHRGHQMEIMELQIHLLHGQDTSPDIN